LNLWHRFLGWVVALLHWLAQIFAFAGPYRWALAVGCVAVVCRLILLPLWLRQAQAFVTLQAMKPRILELQDKHRNDRVTLAAELVDLHRQMGSSPTAIWLPTLVQIPILIAISAGIRQLTKTVPHRTMAVFVRGDFDRAARATVSGLVLVLLLAAFAYVSSRQLQAVVHRERSRFSLFAAPAAVVCGFTLFPISTGVVLYWGVAIALQCIQQRYAFKTFAPSTRSAPAESH
jgi:YidC/Oxa1 family membrane protein insertase